MNQWAIHGWIKDVTQPIRAVPLRSLSAGSQMADSIVWFEILRFVSSGLSLNSTLTQADLAVMIRLLIQSTGGFGAGPSKCVRLNPIRRMSILSSPPCPTLLARIVSITNIKSVCGFHDHFSKGKEEDNKKECRYWIESTSLLGSAGVFGNAMGSGFRIPHIPADFLLCLSLCVCVCVCVCVSEWVSLAGFPIHCESNSKKMSRQIFLKLKLEEKPNPLWKWKWTALLIERCRQLLSHRTIEFRFQLLTKSHSFSRCCCCCCCCCCCSSSFSCCCCCLMICRYFPSFPPPPPTFDCVDSSDRF